jgi:predicted regulator of Ras-like GTPase activity (Roadblock/LC7/MglB family)
MARIKDVLTDLVDVEGIKSGVVVGRDGFVIEGVTRGEVKELEAVGAVVSTGIGSAERMGKELLVGLMTQGMLEYQSGVIVLSPLGQHAVLAVVADLGANLGNVRYQVKKRMDDLIAAM